MNKRKFQGAPVALAVALALTCGLAAAQTGSGASGSSAGSTSTGSSMTGGQSAPAAQPGAGTQRRESKKDDQLASADRKFIEQAAGGGMFEVEAGKLAAQKASDPNVKSFGNMLVDEHSAANNELVQLANSKHVELPAAPPRAERREIEKLGKKSGSEFDKDFLKEVGLKDHQKDIKMFEKAEGKVKDPDLKAWITKTLPHLREHYAMAQKLSGKGDAKSMGASR